MTTSQSTLNTYEFHVDDEDGFWGDMRVTAPSEEIARASVDKALANEPGIEGAWTLTPFDGFDEACRLLIASGVPDAVRFGQFALTGEESIRHLNITKAAQAYFRDLPPDSTKEERTLIAAQIRANPKGKK